MGSHAGHMMPAADGGDTRALVITGWLTGIYFGVELGIGIWLGSVAVLSDAFHTFSAVGGVLIALVAGNYARRPASRYSTFGLIRAEIMGALVNGVFLLGMAIFIFWMGATRIADPVDLATTPMLAVAGGGLVTEFIAIGLLYRRQKTNLNIKGAYWHVLQTFAGSLIIIVAAVVIRFTDYLEIDPILGMAFGALLLVASWSIIRESARILLDVVPRDLDLNAVRTAIESLPKVSNVHHMHAWSLTTGKNIFSTHVLLRDGTAWEDTVRAIQRLLKERFGIYFSTVQAETEVCEELESATDIDFLTGAGEPAPNEGHQGDGGHGHDQHDR